MKENPNLFGILAGSGSLKTSVEITENGIYDTAELPAIDPGKTFRVSLGKTDAQFSQRLDNCLALVVDRQNSIQAIEALLISHWEKAKWVEPGRILLAEQVYLEGPWEVSAELKDKFALTGEYIYLLNCPTCRYQSPVAAQFLGVNLVVDAYCAGEPYGLEREAIESIFAIATRLEGELLVPPSAHISNLPQLIKPNPLEKIGIDIYAQAWLQQTRLMKLLEYFIGKEEPENRDIKIVYSQESNSRNNVGYQVFLEIGRGSAISIQVCSGSEVNQSLPPVLRYVSDRQRTFARYSLQYQESPQMDGSLSVRSRLRPARRQNRSRALAGGYIERIAIMLNVILKGYVVDENGFLLEGPE